MITTEVDKELLHTAARLFLIETDYEIEAQLEALENAGPNAMHVDGVHAAEIWQYHDAKNLLKEIAFEHQALKDVYEQGFKAGTVEWQEK